MVIIMWDMSIFEVMKDPSYLHWDHHHHHHHHNNLPLLMSSPSPFRKIRTGVNQSPPHLGGAAHRRVTFVVTDNFQKISDGTFDQDLLEDIF